MDPHSLFDRLCQRHGLDPAPLARYVPLLERALASPDSVRDRILAMVEDSLARMAGGDPAATFEALERDLDDEVLVAVAQRLHGWTPPWRRERDPRPLDGDDLGSALPEGL